MRNKLALAICALAICAAPVLATAQSSSWTYAYVDGAATATHRDGENVIATMTCRPPDGDIIITDATFGRGARNATRAQVRIGAMSVDVPATSERQRRNKHRITIHLPQRPPILAAVQPNDQLSVTVNGETHIYANGGPARMAEVAYACWQGT